MDKKRRRSGVRKSEIISPASPLEIKNVVAAFQLSLEKIHLDLIEITYHIEGQCFPEQFPAVVGRMKETKTRFGICSTGKVILTGSPSCELAELTAYLLTIRLQTLYPHLQLQVYNLYYPNIVCCCSLGYGLDMIALYQWTSHHSEFHTGYKQDLFQGMAIEVPITKNPLHVVKFIVFENGKMNVIGIKKLSDLPLIEDKRTEIFKPFSTNRGG